MQMEINNKKARVTILMSDQIHHGTTCLCPLRVLFASLPSICPLTLPMITAWGAIYVPLLAMLVHLLLPKAAKMSSSTLACWLSLHFSGLPWVPLFQRVPQHRCLKADSFMCIFFFYVHFLSNRWNSLLPWSELWLGTPTVTEWEKNANRVDKFW